MKNTESGRLIMVVGRQKLFGRDCFSGFMPHGRVDFEARILANHEFMERALAESNFAYKQPIGYVMIANCIKKQVFVYRRSQDDSRYSEKRLQGKWTWGIGGHIEKQDAKSSNPIRASVLRELREEVEANVIGEPEVLGYVNYDTDDVGKVHFGILYIVETDSAVRPKDTEIESGRLMSIEELEKINADSVEEWSKISLAPLKSRIQNL